MIISFYSSSNLYKHLLQALNNWGLALQVL